MSAPKYRDDFNKDDVAVSASIAKVEKEINSSPERGESRPSPKQRSFIAGIIHSFRRAEYQRHLSSGHPEFDVPQSGDTSHLHRKLKGRHLQMIAIGGAIGAGLFIGSGKALSTGGPGAVVLDFGLIGIMLFCVVNALGELATLFPVQGKSSKRCI
jgi:amino acid transporter